MNKTRYSVLIIGGGTAGIDVAARLHAKAPKLDIAIIDPSEKHYYQPLWTLVGGGVTNKEVTEKNEADLIPSGVTWIRDAVVGFEPAENRVRLRSDRSLGYDYLVVCPGIQVNWKDIKGLKETMGRNGVCSNFDFNRDVSIRPEQGALLHVVAQALGSARSVLERHAKRARLNAAQPPLLGP
jgi:sulfide:quinone oxidoreductase